MINRHGFVFLALKWSYEVVATKNTWKFELVTNSLSQEQCSNWGVTNTKNLGTVAILSAML